MHFQLVELILWPEKAGKEVRTVPFETGKLNVITGASRTGKSAIIPIIDYCLASSKCVIPVDVIRDACSWFGIVVKLSGEKLLLARKSPIGDKIPTEMFRLRGNEIVIPSQIIEGNTSVSEVKLLLNGLAGIPSLRLDADIESESGFSGSASFRDMISFNFQPQNVVANQNVLFYKVESYKYREKLKAVFPFALGAITASILAKQYELKSLNRILQQKEREYQKLKSVSERWIAEVKSNVSRAVEYGIWPEDVDPVTNDIEFLVSNLKEITLRSDIEFAVSDRTIDSTIETLKELRLLESDLSIKLAEQRNNKANLDRLQRTYQSHSKVSELKRDRLKLSDWLLNVDNQEGSCPMCGNLFGVDNDNLQLLSDAFHQFELDAKGSIEMPAAFYREFSSIRQGILENVDKLDGVQKQIRALEVSSEKLKKERYRRDEALRFVGALGNSLNTLDEIQDDGGLKEEVVALQKEVERLSREVSENKIHHKKRVALEQISRIMATVLPKLDIENRYAHAPCELSITDLALKITLNSGAKHFLSEIGSGSNWISYHVALTIALHRYFSDKSSNPVASFVIYDQPSQVYFPRRLAYEGHDITDGTEPDLDRADDFTDEDVEAVKKIFKNVANAIAEDKGRWQALILDHAPDSVWKDIPNVHKVAEWRDGEKLIPTDWYSEN